MRTVCTESGWSPNPADLNCTGIKITNMTVRVPYIRELVDSLVDMGLSLFIYKLGCVRKCYMI